MIINLWSTPRTGSVWYSFKLLLEYKKLNPKTVLLTEIFNPWHFGIYRLLVNGNVKNFHHYEPGFFYEEYTFDPDGYLIRNKIFAERSRNAQEEELYRRWIIDNVDLQKNTLIMHNHVHPLPIGIYDMLFHKAERNIFIGRESFLDQISSYAVAIATKNFSKFSNTVDPIVENLNVDPNTLKQLTDRIIFWDNLNKSNCEVLNYENIDFSEIDNPTNILVPVKQNISKAFDKLSEKAQEDILQLREYYESKCYASSNHI